MSSPRTAPETTDEPTVGALTAAQARSATCRLDDIYPHEVPRLVRYHGSKVEHHGPAWLVAGCYCVRCWREPWGRAVLLLSAPDPAHVEALMHVRWESFTDA